MAIHIGTSGWSYREWQGRFYPRGLKGGELLDFYVREFAAVEINSTAYRIPTAETVAAWAAHMPGSFRAAIKLPHAITHLHRLRATDHLLSALLTALRPLRRQLGPLLAQLPPALAPDHERLRAFLAMARAQMADPAWPLVVEFRHPGWLSGRTAEILDQEQAGWCLGDMPCCTVSAATPGARFLYLRRHGTTGKYAGSYSDEALVRDAELMRGWAERGAEVYAFFNNTADGAAIADAKRLAVLLDLRAAPSHPANAIPSPHQEHP